MTSKDKQATFSPNALRFMFNGLATIPNTDVGTSAIAEQRLVAGHNAAAEIAEFLDRPGEWRGADVCDEVYRILKDAGFTIRDLHEQAGEETLAELEGPTNLLTEYDGSLNALLDQADTWLLDHGYGGVLAAQRQCALDPARSAEAQDMVQHWVARCGLPPELAGELDEVLSIRPSPDVYAAHRGYEAVERGLKTPAEPTNPHYMRGWNCALNEEELFP